MTAFCEHITEGRWRCRFPLGHDGAHAQHINVVSAVLCPCVSLTPCKASCHCADPWSNAACQRCDGTGKFASPQTPPHTEGE